MKTSKQFVIDLFTHLEAGHHDEFFRHVADNVNWQVMGTHPLAGIYHSKEEFFAHTFARLNKILQGGVVMKIHNILVIDSIAVVEMSQLSQGINHKPFNNTYCWIVEFKGEIIVSVKAYLDSALVAQFVNENESKICQGEHNV